ncbi:MAG: hypothetical protein AAGA56_12460 [Myxococcota bacterium]
MAGVDLTPITTQLRETAGVVLADPRLLRRVIKQHRDVIGLVPHERCYAIRRDALAEVLNRDDLGFPLASLPEEVVLVATPSPRELQTGSIPIVMSRIWRGVFHARIHRHLEERVAGGLLDEHVIRQRIGEVGHTEFDEIRATLRHDDLVMPPGDDREVYIEFAALYFELRYFAPRLLITTFPGIHDHEVVEAALRRDVDPETLFLLDKPEEVRRPDGNWDRLIAKAKVGVRSTGGPAVATRVLERPPKRAVSSALHESLMRRSRAASEAQNHGRAAVLALGAATVDDVDRAKEADAFARDALKQLEKRLQAALAPPSDDAKSTPLSWSSQLYLLAERASEEKSPMSSVEGRLLFQLKRAALAHERPQRVVDLATSILSRGKRPVVRSLPAIRALRVAREIAQAQRRVRFVQLPAAERQLLDRLLGRAAERAEANVRLDLGPRMGRAFDEVGLTARSGAERLARDKIIDELLDRALARGFLSFDSLRDALSRNQLKLDDLSGVRELREGDPLLRADAALAIELDGVYRRGDFYLRGLQKASSLPFGTSLGRMLTLTVLLPLGVSFVLLEGITHLVSPVLGWFGYPPFLALNPTSFVVTALVVLAMIHSLGFRSFAREVLELVGVILAWVFLRIPRAVFRSPWVRRILDRPAVRFFIRRVALPAGLAALTYFLKPYAAEAVWAPYAFAGGVFFVATVIMATALGSMVEDFVVDQLAPTWHVISRQWLPGLFRLIASFFGRLMDGLERGIYAIDERLRYIEGQPAVTMLFKGAAFMVWGAVAYVIRLYVTLLIEPEINPLKHFPVVTVAHKILIPVYGPLLAILSEQLSLFGPFIANTVAGVTVFLLPSVFGFLAWELKENYKLYQATRPDRLPPARVGPSGETVHGLLVAGFHSGTLPKLYERLRRAAQRQDEDLVMPRLRKDERGGDWGLGKFREGLGDVERGVRRFVDRELITLLKRCPGWKHGPVSIEAVVLSSNRIRIQLACSALGEESCEITFEEQSGFVVAGIPRVGFINELCRRDRLGRRLFENALAGFYQRAEVDLVREQIEAELPSGVHYDVSDEGLLVWPDRDYRTELAYPLAKASGRVIAPAQVRGEPLEVPPRVLDTRRMFFREQEISWLAWVAAWSAAGHDGAEVPPLLRGVSLLPPETARGTAQRRRQPAVVTELASQYIGETLRLQTPLAPEVVLVTTQPAARTEEPAAGTGE